MTLPDSIRFARVWNRAVVVPYRQVILTEHPAMERFFARRCPHLAGMIAYFGILSIIPGAFLLVSALAWAGALETTGWVVSQLQYVMPEQGADTVVRTVDYLRERSGSLGVIGAVGLVWGTTNFFSCIESGLNIIYGVNNRHFLYQKGLVLMLMFVALMSMTLGMLAALLALPLLKRADEFSNTVLHINVTDAGISISVSFALAFLFFLGCYRFLPNTEVHIRDCWRGALMAALAFEGSVHLLTRWIDQGRDDGNFVFTAFAGALVTLIWFYLMAFVLLAGGVFNWWWVERRTRSRDQGADEEFAGAGVA